MIKLTKTLAEAYKLVENISGERIFDSLAGIYDNSHGGNAYAQELNSLTPRDVRSVLNFMKGAGFQTRLPANPSVQAVKRAITDAVASSSSSSSSDRRSEMFDDASTLEDDEDEGDIIDRETDIKVRRERPMRDDPAASEKVLADLLGHRSETGDED